MQFGEDLAGDYTAAYQDILTSVRFNLVNKQPQYKAINDLLGDATAGTNNTFIVDGDK